MKEDRKTYEDGLAEAWNLAKKMFLYPHEGGYSSTELEEIFGRTEHLWELSPQEAAAKIAEWEEKEIRVNDEVGFSGKTGVVFALYGKACKILDRNAMIYEINKENLTKTGRTIDIAGLLAQIGGTGNARDIV